MLKNVVFLDPNGKDVFDWIDGIWNKTISSVGNYFSHSSTKSIVKEAAIMATKDIESSGGGKLYLDVISDSSGTDTRVI